MIPLTATVVVSNNRVSHMRLWIPLFLVWLLLFPVAILLSPVFLIACLLGEVNPFTVISVLFGIIAALKGTHVNVGDRRSSLSVLVDIP